jgi:hypothetical protein
MEGGEIGAMSAAETEADEGPYASSEPEALLAERVESLVSQKHAAWVSQREEAARRGGE